MQKKTKEIPKLQKKLGDETCVGEKFGEVSGGIHSGEVQRQPTEHHVPTKKTKLKTARNTTSTRVTKHV